MKAQCRVLHCEEWGYVKGLCPRHYQQDYRRRHLKRIRAATAARNKINNASPYAPGIGPRARSARQGRGTKGVRR